MKANNEDSPKSAKTHPFDLTGNEFSKTISFIGLSHAFSNALRNASKRMMIYSSSKCNGLISLLKPGIYWNKGCSTLVQMGGELPLSGTMQPSYEILPLQIGRQDPPRTY
jgi:hypothetical protein